MDYNLKQEIKKLGMTQKGFAEHIGVSEDTVGGWVRGVTPVPNWAKLIIELLHTEEKFNSLKRIFLDNL